MKDALFAGALESLERKLGEEGFSLVVANSHFDPHREREQLINLIAHGIDGVMFVGSERDDAIYHLLKQEGIPYINAWSHDPTGGHPSTGFDHQEAASHITSHLLDLGHSAFGMISGFTQHNDRARGLLAGMRRTLSSHGLLLPPKFVIEQDFGIMEGRQAFRYLMSQSNPPTAVICGADIFAVGVIFESKAMGILVPDHVSVTGFDDIDLASQIDPPLTTLYVPMDEMGRSAAEYLLACLDGTRTLTNIKLDLRLILRKSTARAVR